jgi:hypothetical protein
MIKPLLLLVIKGIFVLGTFNKADIDSHIPLQTSFDEELVKILDEENLNIGYSPLSGLMNRCPHISGISVIVEGIQNERYKPKTLNNLKKICELGIKRIDELVEGMKTNYQRGAHMDSNSRELKLAARNSFSISVLTSSFLYLCQILIYIESETMTKRARAILGPEYNLELISYLYHMQQPVTLDENSLSMALSGWFNNLRQVWNDCLDIRLALCEYGNFWITLSGLTLDNQSKTYEFLHEIMKPHYDLLQSRDKQIKEFFEHLLHDKTK